MHRGWFFSNSNQNLKKFYSQPESDPKNPTKCILFMCQTAILVSLLIYTGKLRLAAQFKPFLGFKIQMKTTFVETNRAKQQMKTTFVKKKRAKQEIKTLFLKKTCTKRNGVVLLTGHRSVRQLLKIFLICHNYCTTCIIISKKQHFYRILQFLRQLYNVLLMYVYTLAHPKTIFLLETQIFIEKSC